MTSSRSPLRLLRGGAAATVATGVALGGHLAGGGDMPSWLGIAVPWWFAVTIATVLAGSRFTLPRMLLAVVSGQALFHGLFALGMPADPSRQLVAPPGSHLDHSGITGSSGSTPAAPAADASAAAEHLAHSNHPDLQMLLWHLLAALITSLLLQRGESVVLRCAGLVRSVLDLLRSPPTGFALPRVVAPRPAPVHPRTTHLGHARRAVLTPQLRRGPPMVLAA